MALPMDEQRILEEMERMLAADDPRLAARLAAFGQPGFGQVLRTRRARATLSVMLLVLIAAVAAVIYLMSALRSGSGAGGHGQHSSQTATPSPGRMTTPSSGSTGTTQGSGAAAQPGSSEQSAGARRLCTVTFVRDCGSRWSPAPAKARSGWSRLPYAGAVRVARR